MALTPFLLAALAVGSPVASQTAQQAAQLARNADLVRQRLQSSGLTPEQVRGRLQAAGYDPALLDAYLTDDPGPGPEPSAGMLAALEALEPEQPIAEGLEVVPVETGPEVGVAETTVDGLPLFGLDVFRGRTTQFQPLLTGPVPPNYRVGPGDQMVLVITGDVERVHDLTVTREGFVVIPQVGQLFVNELTMRQLDALLRERLGRSFSGIQTGTTAFDVTIARLRTNQVFVIGEVVEPGAYQLASVATVLNGLYAAGGPTERGNFRSIRVQRFGETVAELDLYEYLLSGDTNDDVMLHQGDVVFVPTRDLRVRLTGAVLRPAIYELAPGETLLDLLDYAGGVTRDAALHRARITRVVPPDERTVPGLDRTVIDVELSAALSGGQPAAALAPGDEVRVFEVREEVRNTVRLEGEVWYPGEFEYRRGMTAWDLIRRGQGLQPEAYLERAHIVRTDPALNTVRLLPFSLDTTAAGEPLEDPALTEYDVVEVFSLRQFADEFPVTISGEVREPGPAVYQVGMTLRDLVLLGGGLNPTADLTLEVARLGSPNQRAAGQIAEVLRLRVDSSYVIPAGRERFYLGHPDSLRLPPDDAAATFELQPYDHVFVRRVAAFEPPRVVRVSGEVAFPGSYSLRRKDERLSELIRRTGGLTAEAFADGFRLYRDGRQVNVDLAGVLGSPGHRDDIVLQPDDSMTIPEYDPVVRVRGGVVSETDVLYRPGAGLDYYIENAGGFARNADRERISVRYANGEAEIKRRRLFIFSATPRPGPGSVVTVGTRPEPESLDVTALVASVAQIAASTVAIVVIALR